MAHKQWLLALLVVICVNLVGAAIIDPSTVGFNSQNRTENGKNMTLNWRTNNASFSVVTNAGLGLMVVPWFVTADNTNFPTQIHSCQISHLNKTGGTTNTNESFCMVSDEFTRAFYTDMLFNNNDTLAAYYMNSLMLMNDTGNAYTNGITGSGNLTEWTAYINYSASTGWALNVSNTSDVNDTATDADAYAILGLAKINSSQYYNSTNKVRAGNMLNKMCIGIVTQELRSVTANNLTYKHRSGNLTWVASSGSNTNSGLGSGSFYYQGYDGPILESMAACRHYYNDSDSTGTYNWSQIADGLFGARLQASNWTGAAFKVPVGRQGHWLNTSSGNSPYYVCDQNCNSSGGSLVPGSDGVTLGVEFPDSMRTLDACRAAYVWQNLTNISLTNASTYCGQAASSSVIAPTATSCNMQKYDQNGASYSGGTASGGFREMGLCMALDFLNNNSNFASKVTQYNSHYACSGGKCSMDSQEAFGVYDKSMGLTSAAYAYGLADSIFNVTAASSATSSGVPTPTIFYKWNNNNFADSIGNWNGTNHATTNITGKIFDARNFGGAGSVSIDGYHGYVGSTSWSVWVYINNTPVAANIMGADNAFFLGTTFSIASNGTTFYFMNNVLNYINNPTTGAWHHYVITRDDAASNRTVVWYDNTIVFNRSLSGSNGLPAVNFEFGNLTGLGKFNGSMDAAGIWDGQVLNQSQVTVLWNASFGSEYDFSGTVNSTGPTVNLSIGNASGNVGAELGSSINITATMSDGSTACIDTTHYNYTVNYTCNVSASFLFAPRNFRQNRTYENVSSVNLTFTGSQNKTLNISANQYDEVDNVSFTMKDYASGGVHPSNISIWINNTNVLNVSSLQTSVAAFNNGSTNLSVQYVTNTTQTIGYFQVPKNATVTGATMNFTSSYGYTRFLPSSSNVTITNPTGDSYASMTFNITKQNTSSNASKVELHTGSTYANYSLTSCWNTYANSIQYNYNTHTRPNHVDPPYSTDFYGELDCQNTSGAVSLYSATFGNTEENDGGGCVGAAVYVLGGDGVSNTAYDGSQATGTHFYQWYFSRSLQNGVWSSSARSTNSMCLGLGTNSSSYLYEMASYQYMYPSNAWMEAGTINGTRLWSVTGFLNGTQKSNDMATRMNAYLSTCTADSNGYCTVPVYLYSDTGAINVSNVEINYTLPSPTRFSLNSTIVQRYLYAKANATVLPINISSSTAGIIEIASIQYDYAGGNYSVNITAHNANYSVTNTSTITLYHSRWLYSYPNNTNFIEFIPSLPTSKMVGAYRQTNVTPVLNITAREYGMASFNFTTIRNESYSCVNLTFFTNGQQANPIVPQNSSWSTINLSMVPGQNIGVWMYANYSCNFATWKLWKPKITMRACSNSATTCDTTVT